jgi:hypothetical protein
MSKNLALTRPYFRQNVTKIHTITDKCSNIPCSPVNNTKSPYTYSHMITTPDSRLCLMQISHAIPYCITDSAVFQAIGISVQVSTPVIIKRLDVEKSPFGTEYIIHISLFQLLHRSFTRWGFQPSDQPSSFFIGLGTGNGGVREHLATKDVIRENSTTSVRNIVHCKSS